MVLSPQSVIVLSSESHIHGNAIGSPVRVTADGNQELPDANEAQPLASEGTIAQANKDSCKGKASMAMDSLNNPFSAVADSTLDQPCDYVTEVATAEADVDHFKAVAVLITKLSCDSFVAMDISTKRTNL